MSKKEHDGEFIYLALSFCEMTVEDMVMKKKTRKLEAQDVIRQLLVGLAHLHSLGIGMFSSL